MLHIPKRNRINPYDSGRVMQYVTGLLLVIVLYWAIRVARKQHMVFRRKHRRIVERYRDGSENIRVEGRETKPVSKPKIASKRE